MAAPVPSSIGTYGTAAGLVDAPDVVNAGDIVVILVASASGTPASTGFNLEPGGAPGAAEIDMLWKRSTGSEPSTYSVTGTGINRAFQTLAIPGLAATGNPFRDATVAHGTSGSGSVSLASLLTDDLILWAIYGESGTITVDNGGNTPSGWSRITPTGARRLHGFYQSQASNGGAGPFTTSMNPTGANTVMLGALIPDTSSHIPVTPAFAGDGTLSATATEHYSVTAAFAGSGTLSAATAARLEVFAALSGSGTLSAITTQRYSAAGVLTGSGTLTATATQHYATAAGLSGSGTLTATAIQHYSVAAAFSGAGALTVVARPAASKADFAGTGTLSATTRVRYSTTAAFSGSGALSATTASRLRLAVTGTRISDPLDLSNIVDVTTSIVSWDADLPDGTTMTVETSIDGGTTWQTATNGGTIPGITTGLDLTGMTVQSRITLTGDGFTTPTVHSLSLTVTQAKVSHFVNHGVPDNNRFNLGVYILTTPDRPVGETPTTYQVQGWDKLYLLTHEIGDTYTVGTGTGFLTAVRQAITDAGVTGLPPLIDSTLQGKALQAPMVWHGTVTPTTWLRVINDLLAAIGYRGLWVDADGRFRSEPYQKPQNRAPEWTFDMTDEHSDIVVEGRTYKVDAFEQLNWWLFIRDASPTTPVEGDGLYTIDRTNGAARRPKIVKLTAADQESLVSQGDQIFTQDTQRTATWNIKTGPLPVLGHFDIAALIDPELGPFKTQSSGHSIPLDGGDVTLTLEVVS